MTKRWKSRVEDMAMINTGLIECSDRIKSLKKENTALKAKIKGLGGWLKAQLNDKSSSPVDGYDAYGEILAKLKPEGE